MRRKGASSPPPLSMLGHHRYLLKQLSLDCKASIEPVVSDEERSPLAFPQILPGNEDSCSPRMDYNLVADKVCYGCSLSLASSPLIASVSGHHKWHLHCLRCSECDELLGEERSCFLKHGRIYCKEDYAKLINEAVKCAKCFRQISASDWVRKAGPSVYHLACFACDLCQRQLSTGEQFTIDQSGPDSKLLCKLHFGINKEGDSHDSSSNDGSTSSSSLKTSSKTKRVRTTFTEEQLQVLQANFQIDSNPDGQDLERIAALTGLSKRVTQVWFQNSRARQKKYLNKARGSSAGSWTPSEASSQSWALGGPPPNHCSDGAGSPL